MTEQAHLHAFVPYLTYPDWYRPSGARFRNMALDYRPPDMDASYFQYTSLPIVSRPFNGAIAYRRVRDAVTAFRPDLILNYWLYPDGHAAVKLGRDLGVPVIVTALGSDIRRIDDPATRFLTRRVLSRADLLITVSGELGARACEMGASPERTRTILNGFDSSIFYPGDRAAERARLGLAADAEIVLYVGSLIPTKGLGELADAFVALAARRPGLTLVCGGEGPFRATLEAKAAAAGLSAQLLLPGKLSSPQVRNWMVASNLFCLPSYSEGCPNVVIEALASGRAVVATNVGGIPELVNENNGILMPPRDTPALIAALETALARPWDDQAIAGTYRRSWREVAADTWAVCQEMLANREGKVR